MPSLHLQNMNVRISILLKYTTNVVCKFYLFVTIYMQYMPITSHANYSIHSKKQTTCSGSTTCSVLLTTLNNVGSKTLFNAVFVRP